MTLQPSLFKELVSDDRQMLVEHLLKWPPEVSEQGFCNLIIWRHYCQTRWCCYGDHLLFVEQRPDGSHYLLPPLGPGITPDLICHLLTWLEKQYPGQQAAIERAGRRLVEQLDQRCSIEPEPDHADYLYQRSELAELKGKRLQYKRSLVRRLQKQHVVQSVPLATTHLDDCRRVYRLWQESKAGQVDRDEACAVNECLELFDELPLSGIAIMIDGRIEGFSISEALSPDTWLVLIEKASPCAPGLFPLLAQEACRRYPPHVLWVNRAQDLGIPGLRQAKRALNPGRMGEKWRIRLA